ncbi:MAG: hypothetical protein V1849_01075 [Chloroflexota bacterium]
MSHTVRLEDEVYLRLEATRAKRETFSQAVSKLLDLLTSIGELMNTIEGQRAYTEHQKRELKSIKTEEPPR